MGYTYENGQQPCADFDPNGEDGGTYNYHECPGCPGIRRFCANCHRDHHEEGWDTCKAPHRQPPATQESDR